jgi:hypothetical protein
VTGDDVGHALPLTLTDMYGSCCRGTRKPKILFSELLMGATTLWTTVRDWIKNSQG